MLKLSDLAQRIDFRLGPLSVSPSRRHVKGPAGEVHVEPLVMQAFLLLLHARGRVVTRNELFDQCWGGAMVGDDSLNRAIAGVRRIASETAPDLFEIETIPRTGYRLVGEVLAFQQQLESIEPEQRDGGKGVSRRLLVGSGMAATAAAGAGLLFALRPKADPRFEALMARGDEAFRDGSAFEQWDADPEQRPNLINLYEEAVRLQPDSAMAWGLLAYFKAASANGSTAEDSPRLVAEAKVAIRKAFQIDPKEPNARVAMFLFEGRMLDWIERDRVLRDILATDPNNLPTMVELMPLLQAAGLTRESWMWNERILRASPLARSFLVVRSLKLWILGRIRESDNVIDRVRGLWPAYPFGYWVRFLLFAVTGRPSAARAMLDDTEKFGGLAEPAMWQASLAALETRSPAAIGSARLACVDVAKRVPVMVNDMVMILCALGEKEAAFEVTEGFLLWRGKVVSSGQADGKAIDDYSRRMTQWLFTPPVAVMRADPRFQKLCEDFGLVAYWRARGIKPDYMRT